MGFLKRDDDNQAGQAARAGAGRRLGHRGGAARRDL